MTTRPARAALLLVALLAAFSLATAAGRTLADRQGPPAQAEQPAAQVAPPQTHVPDEAVAAALDLVAALGSEAMYDAEERGRVLQAVRAEGALGHVDEGFHRAAMTLGVDSSGRSPEGTLIARAVPLGYRVEVLTPTRAVVSVWSVALLGVAGDLSRQPVQATWSTEKVTLTLEDGRWRWSGLEHSDGPAPVSSIQVPAVGSVLARYASEFREPRDVP